MIEFGEAEKAAEEIYLRTLDECVDVSDDDLFFFYSCNEPEGDEEIDHLHFFKGHSISIPCESIKDIFQLAYYLLNIVFKESGLTDDVEQFLEEIINNSTENNQKGELKNGKK